MHLKRSTQITHTHRTESNVHIPKITCQQVKPNKQRPPTPETTPTTTRTILHETRHANKYQHTLSHSQVRTRVEPPIIPISIPRQFVFLRFDCLICLNSWIARATRHSLPHLRVSEMALPNSRPFDHLQTLRRPIASTPTRTTATS